MAKFDERRLERLLRPRHVAVLGGKWAKAVIVSCQEMEFSGDIWVVHPNRDSVAGCKTYPDLADLPEPPDAVFLGINRHASIEVIKQLQEMGAGGVVAFASGFAEVEDGIELQQQLIDAAQDMPVIGPNCYGMINYLDGALLWPDVHGGKRITSGVAIITQSSNLSVNLTMQTGGLPIAYMMTLGNQAQISMADLIKAMAKDARVSAIGLHIEGISDAREFAEAVKFAQQAGKPLVAIKAGASEGAQKMTLSHTASLAGSYRAWQAYLAALGVGRIDSIDGFVQALGVLHISGGLKDASILTLSCSGGEASLIADAALRHNIELPPLDREAEAALRHIVNPLVTVSNPFDYHTFDWGDGTRLEATFTAAMKGKQEVSILIIDFPAPHLGRDGDWQIAIEAWKAARDKSGEIAAVMSSLSECLLPTVANWLLERGIIPLRGFDTGLAALAAARDARLTHHHMPQGVGPIDGKLKSMTEVTAKRMLAEHGVNVPQGLEVSTFEEASAFGNKAFAEGKKMVMKITHAAHKTEEGGVILHISNEDDLRNAFAKLHGQEGVLVEQMIDDGIAEVLIGIARDEVLGLYMVLGTGGVIAEALKDTQVLMLPFAQEAIAPALEGSIAMKMIDGFRGQAKGDFEALSELIMAVQNFALAHADELLELDINPVIVRPEGMGAVAVDALIVVNHDVSSEGKF